MLTEIINQVLRDKGIIDVGVSDEINDLVMPIIASAVREGISISHTSTEIFVALYPEAVKGQPSPDELDHLMTCSIRMAEKLHKKLEEYVVDRNPDGHLNS